MHLETYRREFAGKCSHVRTQLGQGRHSIGTAFALVQSGLEILQLGSGLLLQCLSDLNGAIEKISDSDEVFLGETS